MGDTGSTPEVIGGGAPALIADKYRVLRALGEGATGTVYLCEHLALEKQVAVKVLHRELATNPELVTRFQREAQTAARLDHPSLVHVMDFGQDRDGTLYLAMEYVQGRDLASLLNEEWPLSEDRIAHIMGCVLSALSAAHALGIVHRDLKPENILVRPSDDPDAPEVVKICDFGIAHLSPLRLGRSDRPSTSLVTRVTGEGVVVGTPWYMSPEQARAEALDARSDLYSAGVVLFQLLTRTLPFMADSAVAVAVMHCTTPPPPPSGYGPVHSGLETVCLRALSKTREARYQTAAEMLAALKAAVAKPAPSRLLARRSSRPAPAPARASLPAPAPRALPSGDTAQLSSAVTELSTPAVRVSTPPDAARRRKTSLLVAAVSMAVLAIASVPRWLPSQHKQTQHASVQTPPGQGAALEASPPIAPVSVPMSLPDAMSSGAPELESSASTQPVELASVSPVAAPSEPPAAPAPVRAPAPTHAAHPTPAAAEPTRAAKPAPTPAAPAAEEPEPVFVPSRPEDSVEKLHAALNALMPLEGAKAVEPKAAAETIPEPDQAPPPAAAAVTPAAPPAAEGGSVGSARVTIATERASAGVAKANLRTALNLAALTRCYQDALQAGAQLGPVVQASLEVATNLGGRIVSAHVSEGLPQGLASCIEQAARAGSIRAAEVGEVHATFGLRLER